MRIVKPIAIGLLVYVALVGLFESLLGITQPTSQDTMVIVTFDPDGTEHDRVVSRLEYEGRVYAAANHWPRAWFRRATRNPQIEVTYDGETAPHVAVQPDEAERDSVDAAQPLGLVFRVLTGFPPRRFVRLDPLTRGTS